MEDLTLLYHATGPGRELLELLAVLLLLSGYMDLPSRKALGWTIQHSPQELENVLETFAGSTTRNLGLN